MILSAYSVETASKGFAVCSWPAVSLRRAMRLAKTLSNRLGNDPRYPNAFWVVASGDESVCKFYRGQRYERQHTV